MTLATRPPGTVHPGNDGELPPVPDGQVRVEIDGITLDVPKGELVIRAAERIGIAIPRFCDHPLLDPVGACRQCLVEVEMGGRPMPKPQASCTQTVADGMKVKTQLTSPVAEKAQRSNLEFLLLNHPLDCPICDKGGECPLQNQVMANGSATSRMHEAKRVFVKPIAVSTEILLDRERCVLCQRCTRFSEQIAGDPFIDLLERGSAQQIGINSAQPFQSYFSGNTIQICPVGALTSTAYRFRSRPFDLKSTATVCEHCASGCELRTDHRAGVITRRLAAIDPAVNEEWNCDKGRFGFTYLQQPDRLRTPLVRNDAGDLVPASWTEALAVAARGLLRARDTGGVGVLAGGRLTLTDAYAYAKFARIALRTNDVDFRARDHSAEEEAFLAARVAGRTPETGAVTYADLMAAPAVLLVALEPEEESPILFLRLRKAVRRGLPVFAVAPMVSAGLAKLSGTLLGARPGTETGSVRDLFAGGVNTDGADSDDTESDRARVVRLLRTDGAVILVGERAATVPGLLTATAELADAAGARLAWVPRRAGERGAVEAGLLPGLLPGGHPVADPAARARVELAWDATLPATPGRDTSGILAAGLAGLVIGGVDLDDLPDPAGARAALDAAGFVVSLEIRRSEVTRRADVVLPVAAAAERAGAYLNWEGRDRPFDRALEVPGVLDEGRILDTLGVEMDVDLYTQSPVAARADLARLGVWSPGSAATGSAATGSDATGSAGKGLTAPAGAHRAVPHSAGGRPDGPDASASESSGQGGVADFLRTAAHKLAGAIHLTPTHLDEPVASATTGGGGGGPTDGGPAGNLTLASWRMNLDGGSMLDGEIHLAGTARPEVVRLSGVTAERLGLRDGQPARVSGRVGSLLLPVSVSDMLDDVAWVPARVAGAPIGVSLGARPGEPISVTADRS